MKTQKPPHTKPSSTLAVMPKTCSLICPTVNLYNARHLFFTNFRGYGNSSGRPVEQPYWPTAWPFMIICLSIINLSLSRLSSWVAAWVHRWPPTWPANVPMRGSFNHAFRQHRECRCHYYSWLPVRWLLKHKFNTSKFMQQVTAPSSCSTPNTMK